MSKRSVPAGRRETSSDKTLSVMDLFTPERPEWTVEEAAVSLGQSASTVYRYFRSLSAVGLIFSVRPGRYLLGPGIVHYDRQLRLSDPLLRAAEPTIMELSRNVVGPGLLFISRIHRDHVMTVHEHRLDGEPFAAGTFARGRLAAERPHPSPKRGIVSPEEIIEEARNGRMFILVDDEDRENEGDLVIPAQMATPSVINFMARHGRGLILPDFDQVLRRATRARSDEPEQRHSA